MGRLLHKMKRGPRLMTVISKLPPSTVEYFRSTNLTVPILGGFLNQLFSSKVTLNITNAGSGKTGTARVKLR